MNEDRPRRIQSYKDLIVWQEGMDLAADCYRLSLDWPDSERYGMITQVRRAAASIPANIAEGYGRGTRKSYLQFAYIAQGSLKETETHLLLAQRVGVSASGSADATLALADRLGRRLNTLIRALQRP